MIWISDDAIARLGALPDMPDFTGTRYRLLNEIDRGGMGVIYAAEDAALGREVAIKVLRDGLIRHDAADRLEREAKILAALEHPGIVPVHDAGMLADGRAWYVMKRVRGARVDTIARSGLSVAEALRLFVRACEPVAFAHARGVVHRDLKPENIMVGEFGEVLVMDWGVAKLLGDECAAAVASRPPSTVTHRADPLGHAAGRSLTSDGDLIGTRGYMAPEQERGETRAISTRTDVWALGTILGELALAATAHERARIPKALTAIIAKATALDPSDRYATAAELAADIVRFGDGNRVEAHKEAPWERIGRWVRRNKVAVAVVLAYLAMRAVIFLWFGR
ncbi:MAG: serine/threonine protein kinase [Acidobacteria bacterium]|nr:serine/threonine protein kinase [Acidobacteriota bacterium]